MWFFVVCTLTDNEYASLLFPKHFFELFLHIDISEFANFKKNKSNVSESARISIIT